MQKSGIRDLKTKNPRFHSVTSRLHYNETQLIMVNYRRNYVKGGTYFFTVTLKNRQSTLLYDAIELLRESFAFVQTKKPFTIVAIVVLPEHLHCIWQLPENDNNYPARWKSIKSRFTRKVKNSYPNIYKNSQGEYNVWQRRYWEHTIRDENDLNRHIDYIHYNPVKHGLVSSVAEWSFSSFHRYVKDGVVPLNWGHDVELNKMSNYGE